MRDLHLSIIDIIRPTSGEIGISSILGECILSPFYGSLGFWLYISLKGLLLIYNKVRDILNVFTFALMPHALRFHSLITGGGKYHIRK